MIHFPCSLFLSPLCLYQTLLRSSIFTSHPPHYARAEVSPAPKVQTVTTQSDFFEHSASAEALVQGFRPGAVGKQSSLATRMTRHDPLAVFIPYTSYYTSYYTSLHSLK